MRSGAASEVSQVSQLTDTTALRLPDTLPAYTQASTTTRMETERNQAAIEPLTAQVVAAMDALSGLASIPPRLKLNEYRREGSSVVIDLIANDLPKMRFLGAGGTVRILEDGRRIILARHN